MESAANLDACSIILHSMFPLAIKKEISVDNYWWKIPYPWLIVAL